MSEFQENYTAILLAVYDGERYIGELLESLCRQTCKDFTVYVHDDCSKDRTLEIIRSFQERLSIVVMDDPEPGRGACKSFLRMLEHVDAQYYFFCDQDDVWLPEKVEKSLNALRSLEQENGSTVPCISCCDLRVVDAELNTIAESFWGQGKLLPEILMEFPYLAGQNFAAGCTLCFNRAMKNMAFPLRKNIVMHDHYLLLLNVANHGVVKILHEPLILYRQHGGNVIGAVNGGASDRKNCFAGIADRLKNLRRIWHENTGNFRQANEIRKISFLCFFLYRIKYMSVRNGRKKS